MNGRQYISLKGFKSVFKIETHDEVLNCNGEEGIKWKMVKGRYCFENWMDLDSLNFNYVTVLKMYQKMKVANREVFWKSSKYINLV